MTSQNGTTYLQNYDLIVKWFAEALQGETLEVLGVKTGRIQDVFGFELIDIPVKAERVDVMARDDMGVVYHLEEHGKDTGIQRGEMVEELLRFERELYQADKIPVRLLVATLIMSNKLIDKDRLRQIWEEIKMLDIFDIAKEEGLKEGLEKGKMLGVQEGKTLGVQEGKTLGVLEATREMLVEALIERFDLIPAHLSERIRTIRNQDVLKSLFHQAFRCQSLQDFESLLQQVT